MLPPGARVVATPQKYRRGEGYWWLLFQGGAAAQTVTVTAAVDLGLAAPSPAIGPGVTVTAAVDLGLAAPSPAIGPGVTVTAAVDLGLAAPSPALSGGVEVAGQPASLDFSRRRRPDRRPFRLSDKVTVWIFVRDEIMFTTSGVLHVDTSVQTAAVARIIERAELEVQSSMVEVEMTDRPERLIPVVESQLFGAPLETRDVPPVDDPEELTLVFEAAKLMLGV